MTEKEQRDRWNALGIRTDVPHPARLYDYIGAVLAFGAAWAFPLRCRGEGGRGQVPDGQAGGAFAADAPLGLPPRLVGVPGGAGG